MAELQDLDPAEVPQMCTSCASLVVASEFETHVNTLHPDEAAPPPPPASGGGDSQNDEEGPNEFAGRQIAR